MSLPTILLVDDSPGDVVLFREALEDIGFHAVVHVAEDGERALTWLEECAQGVHPRPDFVVVDLNLPRVPGIEVLEQVARGDTTGMRVTVLTSSSDPTDVQRAQSRLSCRFMSKPNGYPEFVEVVRRIVTS